MSHPAPLPSEPAISAEQADENTRHSSDVLRSLIDRGHDLAIMAHQKAVAITMEAVSERTYLHKTEDLTLQFERAARTVRRCILLQQKLAEPRPTGYDVALAAQRRAAASNRALATADTPLQDRSDTETVERAERLERLDRLESVDEFNDDPTARPIQDIIAEISADLGLTAPPHIAPGDVPREGMSATPQSSTHGPFTHGSPSPLSAVAELISRAGRPTATPHTDHPPGTAPPRENPRQTPYPLRL